MKYFYCTSLVTLLFIVCGTIQSNAQRNFNPGYLITQTFDTIRGEIDDRGAIRNSKQVTLRSTEDGKVKVYLPEDIAGYHVEGKTYRSLMASVVNLIGEEEKKYFFMKRLVDGRVQFFYFNDARNKERYFILKDQSELTELVNNVSVVYKNDGYKRVYDNQYIATLRLSLTDCDQIDNLSIAPKFHEKAISDLLIQYNNCFRSVKINQPIEEKRFRLQPEAYVGWAYSTVEGSGQAINLDFSNRGISSPLLSLVLKTTAPSMNKALSLNLGADYVRKGAMSKENVQFDFHFLDVRLFPAYTYPKGNFQPTFSAGFIYGVRLNNSDKALTYLSPNGSRKPIFQDKSANGKNESGYTLEVGANILNSKKALRASSWNFRIGHSSAVLKFNASYLGYFNRSSYLKIGYAF